MPATLVTFKPEKSKKKKASPSDDVDMRDNQSLLGDEPVIESDSDGEVNAEDENPSLASLDGVRNKKRKIANDEEEEDEDLDFTGAAPTTSAPIAKHRRIIVDPRIKMVNYSTSFPSSKFHTIIKYEHDNCKGKAQFSCSIPNRAMPALTAACLKFCKEQDVMYYLKSDPKLASG